MPFTDSIKFAEVIMTEKGVITATPEDVVAGKVYVGANLKYETGELPLNDTAGSLTLKAGESYTVPYGKNPIAFTITAEGMSPQTEGDATKDDILLDKTAWVNGEKITGEMPNNEAISKELICSEEYTIPKGYHDGEGKVTARSLKDQTPGSASAARIMIGDVCWSDGVEITGTMPNIGCVQTILDCDQVQEIAKGYHDGTGYVKAKSLAEQTQATATREEILDGKTAWVNGFEVTGQMTKIPARDIVLPLNGEYYIPKGCHTGNGRVTQNIPYEEGQTLSPGKEQQTLEVAGKYMTGDIIVTGVDALSYQRPNSIVKDSAGDYISNYELTVENNKAVVRIYQDNWHDGSTANNYFISFTDLIDKSLSNVSLSCYLCIDWSEKTDRTISCGNVTVEIGIDTDLDCQMINVNNITSGKITVKEKMSTRQFGTT